jgi:hypothetical protein
LVVGANTVERERQNIADPSNASGLAGVVNSAPGGSAYGLVTWNQPSGTQTISGAVSVSNFPATQPVSGTVSTTPPSNASTNLTQVDGVSLGSPSTYGTSPGAVEVIGVNAFVTNTVPVTGTFFQTTQPISGTVTADIVGHAGATLDGTAGSPSTGVLTVQGVSGGTGLPVSGTVSVTNFANPLPVSQSGTWTTTVTQATASNLNATVTGTVSVNALPSGSNTIGKVDILGNAGAAMDAPGQNASSPTNELIVGGQFNTTPTTITSGNVSPLQLDSAGNLLVNVKSGGGSGSNAAAGLTGSAVPTSADYVGFNSGGNLVGVSSSNALPVTVQNSSIAVTGTFFQGTQPVSGTVTANQGTAAATTAGWPIIDGTLAEVTAAWTTGTSVNTTLALTVTGYSSVVVTLNQGSTITGGVVTFEASDTTAFTNAYAIQAVQVNAFTAASTYTLVQSTNQAFEIDVSGFAAFRVRLSTAISGTGTVNVGIAANAMAADPAVVVGGTVTANAGTGNFTVTQATGTNLHVVVDSAPSTAVTNAGTFAVQAAQSGTWTSTVTQATAANLNATVVGSGNFTVTQGTASNLLAKVDIVGNAGAVLDAVTTAATTPANALATLVGNVTTAPSLTTGQSVIAQCDYVGSTFVKPYRRSQTVAKSTAIAVTTATTVLAAQAAGIFADIATLIITAAGITTSVATTATLSDGTASYVFNFIPGTATTAGENPQVYTFNPPLPATSAATAWTMTMSTGNAVNITIVAVLQKAS